MGIADAIGRFLGTRPTPRGTDFYDRAEREPRVPEAEMAVTEAVLVGGGPLAERALRQLRETPRVHRLRAEDGSYEMRIVTFDNLTIRGVPRAGWMSEPIPVETTDGYRMELRVGIADAGIVGITGRTEDGSRWPKAWRIAAASLERIRARDAWLRLPTPAELTAERTRVADLIGGWLHDPDVLRGRRGSLRADPPASDDELAEFEAREAFSLPDAYRDLLHVANGIGIGSLEILGTNDAYRLDIAGPPRLVITPPDEDGAFVLDVSGAVEWIDIDDVAATGTIRAPDLRTWVRRKFRRGSQRCGSAARRAPSRQ
jgi:hypothetical protein